MTFPSSTSGRSPLQTSGLSPTSTGTQVLVAQTRRDGRTETRCFVVDGKVAASHYRIGGQVHYEEVLDGRPCSGVCEEAEWVEVGI